MPAGDFTNLIAEGIIPGLGGIVIFIPQIAFLFLFISILEESGYMSRVVFLNGPHHASLWFKWEECRSPSIGNCLRHSGHYGDPKY